MNTSHLKSYAPQARKDFIAAVTARANLLGLSDSKGVLKVAEAEVKNDIVMIAGRPWPVSVDGRRRTLIARIQRTGFAQTVEAVAYAWFNRLAALRYMELHDYLGHGRRVLSNPAGGLPEILSHALDLAEDGRLPGLSPETVRELKLANQDAELYRQVLIAQCNALHAAMPFLFERLGDETELLLPENLLLTDSVVNKLVQSVPDEDWQNIEIIGWLYQFYISEKKDQVIGKVVNSEDIPAATQLFTPNWIVKYMLQNSLGAQWLATYPDSSIKADMDYYIEPAEQAAEICAQLSAITPITLNPEELTLMDPACGSGHILVEAYDLFKAIYLERGYQKRDVPKLILERNLFGLDIDERAAQLAGFALMMKGRADDQRLFERGAKLNVMALLDSSGFDAKVLAKGLDLSKFGLKVGDLTELKRLFENATTFGSLIQVPEALAEQLPALRQLSELTSHDLFVSETLKRFGPLVQQAELLAAKYDAVVANPPYMGARFHSPSLKRFLQSEYAGVDKDLFSAFIHRMGLFTARDGFLGAMTSFVWMFLGSYESLRKMILSNQTIRSLVQLHYDGFVDAKAHVCTFILQQKHFAEFRGSYVRLAEIPGVDVQGPKTLEAIHNRDCGWFFEARQSQYFSIPGNPIAYWGGDAVRETFEIGTPLGDVAQAIKGLDTCDNDRFMRGWHEVSSQRTSFRSTTSAEASESKAKWFPYCKGGDYRRWAGNYTFVVDWENDGETLRNLKTEDGKMKARPQGTVNYFRRGITFSSITSALFSARSMQHAIFGGGGSAIVPEMDRDLCLALLNSKLTQYYMALINPSVNMLVGDLAKLPVIASGNVVAIQKVASNLELMSTRDWDAYERSWDFQSLPLLTASSGPAPSLESNYTAWITQNRANIAEMKRLEEENNRLFIDDYGLAEEITPDVPIEQITLTVNPAYRYAGNLTHVEQWARFRQDTMEEFVSYAVGCMMGRYSLDAPGLIYAHAGNVGFDPSRYAKFKADADGIVPITDDLWFEDDGALRVREFLKVTCGQEQIEQNVAWLADVLGRKTDEGPEEAIRRYLANKFFKDHLQTYKKRPIYWLFSSGKHGAFQALVYLHRYNAGTLSRLRAEYVVPLTGKMQSRIEQLERDVSAASSTAVRNRLNKKIELLRKQHLELLAYDEQLRHYADMRIELNLDDGVKVNYGKFGDLLAGVKDVVGMKDED